MYKPEDKSTKKDIRIFISYSHKDEAWKDMLVTHLKPLVHQGDIVLWDDRKIGTGTDWYQAIKEEIDKADITICLISADFLASDFINKEEIPDIKRRRKDEGMLLLPLLLSPCAWNAVKWLKGIQMFPRDGVSLEEIRSKVQRKKTMADYAVEIHERITTEDFSTPVPVSVFAPPEKIDITRLPETGAQLFGRDKELQLLDEMWDSGSSNIASLVAWGGVGKSTLVNKWLEYLKIDNYRGAKRVFGWSFYSQGTGQRVTSADQFMSEALTWFGDPDPTQGSPWDKGQRLADLIRREKTLLILDGLEPLQSGLDFEKGKINDPALSVLVTQLSKQNNGLCVITTREKVAELENFPKTSLHVDLEQISKEAGRALLRAGGVRGTDEELETASEAFGNHALGIKLLAAYLQRIEGHHISNAVSIPDFNIPDAKGRHARRIMEAFDRKFDESPQRNLLCIMGLFDRPPDLIAIKAVKSLPPIERLTDKISNLTKSQWYDLLDELRVCGLLAPKSKHNPNVIDCHPLVREHFGDKLKNKNPEAWCQGHRRLYEHLTESTKYRPDTLVGLQPLYQAVAHGCQAGMHKDVLYHVYANRILRGTDDADAFYSISKLGAVGSDLAAISCFFERPWTEVSHHLPEDCQAWLLNEAAFRLRAMGHLIEALEPFQTSLDMCVCQENWMEATIRLGNLSELKLMLGQITKAVQDAKLSVNYTNSSDDTFQRRLNLTTLANVMFHAGKAKEAYKLFRKAETMQVESQPQYTLLYSVPGFHYCDLLLAPTERAAWQCLLQFEISSSELRTATTTCHAVKQRAIQTFKWAKEDEFLLDIALNHLNLGWTALYDVILKKSKPTEAIFHLTEALNGFRRAGMTHHIPRGLLSCALLRFVEDDTEGCQADLDEARQIAERGSMRLYMADVLLHRGRLFHDKAALAKAARLIDECGYHRRDEELADAQVAAKNW